MLKVKVVYENRQERWYALWVYVKSPNVYPLVTGPTYYTFKALHEMKQNFPEIEWEELTKSGDIV